MGGVEGAVVFIIPLRRIVLDNWLESPWWPAKLWEKGLIFAAWAVYSDCEKASSGCLAWLLCYLWTAKLQVGAAALIQQNAANPLQHYWSFLVDLFVFFIVVFPSKL